MHYFRLMFFFYLLNSLTFLACFEWVLSADRLTVFYYLVTYGYLLWALVATVHSHWHLRCLFRLFFLLACFNWVTVLSAADRFGTFRYAFISVGCFFSYFLLTCFDQVLCAERWSFDWALSCCLWITVTFASFWHWWSFVSIDFFFFFLLASFSHLVACFKPSAELCSFLWAQVHFHLVIKRQMLNARSFCTPFSHSSIEVGIFVTPHNGPQICVQGPNSAVQVDQKA